MERLSEGALVNLVSAAFEAHKMRADMAKDAARMLVTAEMMGIQTHGLARVAPYAARLRDGGVNPDALPIITRPAPALVQVDGQNGLGAAVAVRATRAALEAAREVGMCAAFCRASSHLGALAPQLLEAANAGFAAIFTTNTSPMIAPAGGRRPVVGNTPLGIAIPDAHGDPVILDIALTVAARSKVRQAATKGAPIPPTWATDAEGKPTTDATEAMKGLMQAIGWNTRVRFTARRKIIDATQCWHRVPEKDTPRFTHDDDVLVIAPKDLSAVWSVASGLHDKYCVLGAGSVAVETVGQLLRFGVKPSEICWVKPRDTWFLNRDTFNPRAWLNTLQAIAETTEPQRLGTSLEKAGHLIRVFSDETPTKFHADVAAPAQLAPLRTISHVIRRGQVLNISSIGMILKEGVEPMPERTLYIDCTASRIITRPRPPVFQASGITLQMMQMASPEFSGSLIAAIELLNRSDQEKNRLCPPLSLPERATDLPMLFAENLRNQHVWLDEPELYDWLIQNRLGSTGKLLSSILASADQRQFAIRQFQHLLTSALDVLSKVRTHDDLSEWSAFSEASLPHLQTGTEPD